MTKNLFSAGGLVLSAAFVLSAAPAHAGPPVWIEFAPGSYGAIAQGRVKPGDPLTTYKLTANGGQTMILTFVGAGPMRGQVQCAGGVGGGPYYGTGDSIALTTTGECEITVGANTMAEEWTGGFTLAVLIK